MELGRDVSNGLLGATEPGQLTTLTGLGNGVGGQGVTNVLAQSCGCCPVARKTHGRLAAGSRAAQHTPTLLRLSLL